MKTIRTSLTAAFMATALGLSMASGAWAASDGAGEPMSDAWITTKVKAALLAEDSTPGMEIEVETKDGVVSLSGTVATEAQREAAIAEAKTIQGVRDVMADGLKAVE